ncbi:MAG: radical SAM protein, partial [Ruminococcus sp.]|nr:radical SAM protein [Ruminococcus sp.]
PRRCGVNRYEKSGFCGAGAEILSAKASLHQWEEPCISYRNGAGTVFFSGCSLHCCFCQNNKISNELFGKSLTDRQLADVFLRLQDKGADNIELVTPTHFVPSIIKALDLVKHRLEISVIYNSGGYELTETIDSLNGYIDVYMPDIKYFSSEVSERYSNAPDYFKYASSAVLSMVAQVGKPVYNEHGGLIKGVLIRHLVLPSHRHDSMKIMEWIAENIPPDSVLVSIMNQYTPFEFTDEKFSEIKRRVTKMEYNSVVRHAVSLGINGYTQQSASVGKKYVPNFDLSGL